jgi:hypothetical protein
LLGFQGEVSILRSHFLGLEIIRTWIDRQLHRERAVTERIFQALPNFCPDKQTDTTVALIYNIII